MKRTVVAGSRLAPQVARFIAEGLGVEVCHAWGMTETSPLATIERYDRGNVLGHGKPVFGIEVAVRDAAGSIGTEGHGELLVRGHWVAHRSQADGEWLPTGDLVCLHADSQLEIIDRLDEAVTATGVTVSSALVEYHARTVDGVADAALLAPERPGEGCTLVWVGNSVAEPAAVETRMADLLAAQFGGWSPDAFVVIDALPYTPSAKVQKRMLRQQVAAAPNARAMAADIPLSISSLQP